MLKELIIMFPDVIVIVLLHWVADFILQTRWQGNNKSKSLKALLSHTTTYSLCFLLLFPLLGTKTLGFVLITWMLHTLTDYFTSRATAHCWKEIMHSKDRIKSLTEAQIELDQPYRYKDWIDKHTKHAAVNEGWFWGIIGFDQALHYIQLILTYNFL